MLRESKPISPHSENDFGLGKVEQFTRGYGRSTMARSAITSV